MSIDKVVIQGAEFTRVAERYLLQSEVEQALAYMADRATPQWERLTSLLEDMVMEADRLAMLSAERPVALPVARDDSLAAAFSKASATEALAASVEATLTEVRETLRLQIERIERHLNRLDG